MFVSIFNLYKGGIANSISSFKITKNSTIYEKSAKLNFFITKYFIIFSGIKNI